MQLPKLTGIFGSLKAPEVVAVFTAAIVTPIIYPYVTKWIANIPFLAGHTTIAAVLVAILLFVISTKVGNGPLRSVIVGLAGAFVLIGFAPFIQKYLPQTVVP